MALELDEVRRPVAEPSPSPKPSDEEGEQKGQTAGAEEPANGTSVPSSTQADTACIPRMAVSEDSTADSAGPLCVRTVKVEGKATIQRIEITYSDGSVWAMGPPVAKAKTKAKMKNRRDDGVRIMVLSEDEFITEVKHEPLLQWWWVGAALELRTNKGRCLEACGTWSSGLEENAEVFRAASGCAVLGLRLHNGRCHGIVEGPAPPVDELELKMWAVYWLAEGSADDEIQSRNFVGRESAFSFAQRVGGGHEMAWQCGPLRLSVSDHPWLDCCRDLRDLLRPARLAALEAREVAEGADGAYVEFGSGEKPPAGVVLDLVSTSRVKAWGPHMRRKKCEELASEQGQFNLKRWRDMSMSLAETLERIQSARPTLGRLVAMMDLRRHLARTLFTAVIAAVMSTCDSIKTVLSGAVFTLINASEEDVKKDSQFLHIICSWTFGCGSRISLAKSLILGLMLLAVIKGTVGVVSQHVAKAFKDSYRVQTRTELFDHLLAQDLEEFEKQPARVMANKASPAVMDGMPNLVTSMVRTLTELLTSLIFLYSISPLMTFMYATAVPAFQVAAQAYLRKQAKGSQRRERGLEGVANRVVSEACEMIKVVKTFSREDWHTSLQRLSLEEAASMKLTATQGAAQVAADTLQQAIFCISLWLGLVWVNVDSSAAEMTSFLLLVSKLGHQVNSFKAQVEDIFNISDNLAEHFEFLDQQPKVFPGTYDGPVEGHVVFEDVTFAYPTRPEQKVLHGLSMELQPGKTTALVGASGSGKSTSVQLIFRYYDPYEGAILIDGVPLKDWDLTHLHRHMALVAQEPVLFNTSVRQNLLYGLPQCRIDSDPKDFEEKMIAAAKAACAHEFIQSFPGGYDTNVGDRGGQVSGGQKQRLSVARAILMQPRILVLDEATSALDAESESIVQEALDCLVANSGSSVMVIAHRLSTVRQADEIICLREGHVVERGTSKELMELRGYYYTLVEKQAVTLDDIGGANAEIDRSMRSRRASVGGKGVAKGTPDSAATETSS
ncbi:unnamed protein product [Effrenium voratum]|nr:unnamed protein product [Effrenium voratum]